MRSSTTFGHNTRTATQTYSPSVPLSVYRELAAQLQAAEERLDSLNAQNQQLAKQNQHLRQEIEKAVFHLQQIADSAEVDKRTYTYHPTSYSRSEPSLPVSEPRSMHRSSRPPTAVQSAVEVPSPFPTREARSVLSEKVFTEQEQGRYRRRFQPETASEVSGWLLAIAILLIVATAFGGGYLIVRPLLQSRQAALWVNFQAEAKLHPAGKVVVINKLIAQRGSIKLEKMYYM